MNDIERFRERIDACRPGGDDLALPELAELRQAAEQSGPVAEELARCEQFDMALAAALQDAPLPSGLLDRILTRATTARVVEQAAPRSPAAALAVRAAPQADFRSRRWSIVLGGSLAALFVVGLTMFVLRSRQAPTVSAAELSPLVDQWLLEIFAPPKANARITWSKSTPPAAYAAPPVVLANPQRWMSFKVGGPGWSGTGVAIDLAPVGAPRAVLFVVSSPARFTVASTPITAVTLTGRTKAIAWQNSQTNLLYVLVVEEDRGQRLERFLKPQPTA